MKDTADLSACPSSSALPVAKSLLIKQSGFVRLLVLGTLPLGLIGSGLYRSVGPSFPRWVSYCPGLFLGVATLVLLHRTAKGIREDIVRPAGYEAFLSGAFAVQNLVLTIWALFFANDYVLGGFGLMAVFGSLLWATMYVPSTPERAKS